MASGSFIYTGLSNEDLILKRYRCNKWLSYAQKYIKNQEERIVSILSELSNSSISDDRRKELEDEKTKCEEWISKHMSGIASCEVELRRCEESLAGRGLPDPPPPSVITISNQQAQIIDAASSQSMTTVCSQQTQKKLLPTQTTTTPSEASGSTSQGSSETEMLGHDDQADVEEALQNLQDRWREIGTQLHVHISRLNTFQNLLPSVAMGMVVSEYLSRNYNVEKFGPPTWMKIVGAVRKPAGGNNNAEADKISKKYIG